MSNFLKTILSILLKGKFLMAIREAHLISINSIPRLDSDITCKPFHDVITKAFRITLYMEALLLHPKIIFCNGTLVSRHHPAPIPMIK